MRKKKIIIQSVVCVMIAAGYGLLQHIEAPAAEEKVSKAVAAMSMHYTVSDIADKGRTAVVNIVRTPAVVTGKIISSQEAQKYGAPADDIPEGETGSVYAVAGGKVIETGTDEQKGMYIKISHEDSVSIYGNCDRIYAEENEYVRKGQVIASFTNDGEKDFYFELEEAEKR